MDTWKYGALLERIRSARDCIGDGFIWRETQEGDQYWAEVYNKLTEMAHELAADKVIKRLDGADNG